MMPTFVVLGASGALGREFVDHLINLNNDFEIFCVFRSENAIARFRSYFFDTSRVQTILWDEFLIGSSALPHGAIFFNFGFVGNGVPWSRPFREKQYLRDCLDVAVRSQAAKFIQVSTQSVFGYSLKRDVSTTSSYPSFLPEYGQTKRASEEAVLCGLQGSSVDFYLVRLGAVFHKRSAPFMQRILFHYHCDFDSDIDLTGYVNGCMLPNVLSGLVFIASSDFRSSKKVYHFSEVGFYRWRFVFDTIDQMFDRPVISRSCASSSRVGFVDFLKKISRSYFFYFLVFVLRNHNFLPSFGGALLFYLRKMTPISYRTDFVIDSETRSVYREKHKFLNEYPYGFEYSISPHDFDKFLVHVFTNSSD